MAFSRQMALGLLLAAQWEQTAVADNSTNLTLVGTKGESAAVVTNADTVGSYGTKAAEGAFSFAEKVVPDAAIEVSVGGASLARMMEELLTNRRVSSNISIVPEEMGVVQEGYLTNLVIRSTKVQDTKMSTKNDTVSFNISDVACSLTASYDVKFTSLKIPAEGIMNMHMAGGGLEMTLPVGGSGKGTCKFDKTLHLTIDSSSSLDETDDGAVAAGIQSLVASINDNVLSLQDTMLHTVEKTLCTTLLTGLSGDPSKASLRDNAEKPDEDQPVWEAYLAKLGLAPFDFAAGAVVGLLLCCVACSFCGCCWICCCRKRQAPARSPETVPLKSMDDEDDYYNCQGKSSKRGVLNSLSCCRRKGGSTGSPMSP